VPAFAEIVLEGYIYPDATNNWPGETSREWGRPLTMSADVTARVEQLWQTLGL